MQQKKERKKIKKQDIPVIRCGKRQKVRRPAREHGVQRLFFISAAIYITKEKEKKTTMQLIHIKHKHKVYPHRTVNGADRTEKKETKN